MCNAKAHNVCFGWTPDIAEVAVKVHLSAVKRILSKGRSWVVGLDGPSRVSAALCTAPLVVLMATTGPSSADYPVDYSTAYVVIQWLLAVPALLIMTPLVGAAQFGIYWFVRHSAVRWLQWTLCSASAFLLIPYQRFSLQPTLLPTLRRPSAPCSTHSI